MNQKEREKSWTEWAAKLSRKDRKLNIQVSLDEIEAARDAVARMGDRPDALKTARGWIEKHKSLLRILGHKGKVKGIPKVRKA